jgi:hypothetical protein
VSPAASQSLSSSMPFSCAQLYPASCPLQSEVHGAPAKVRGFGVVAEVSVDSVAGEEESEEEDTTVGVVGTTGLERVSK